jgi:hypothetical protein
MQLDETVRILCASHNNCVLYGIEDSIKYQLVTTLKTHFSNIYILNEESSLKIDNAFKRKFQEIYNLRKDERTNTLFVVSQQSLVKNSKILLDILAESRPLQITFIIELTDIETLSEEVLNNVLGNSQTFVIDTDKKSVKEFAKKNLNYTDQEGLQFVKADSGKLVWNQLHC